MPDESSVSPPLAHIYLDNCRLSNGDWRENVVRAYQAIHEVETVEDNWHSYTTERIREFVGSAIHVLRPSVTLEAGCGTFRYAECSHVVPLDFSLGAFRNEQVGIVGDLLHLPIRDFSFDAVLCVGSVLNLVDAPKAISELSRVTRIKGAVILEYERLGITCREERNYVEINSTYAGVAHPLRLYSDRYIENCLTSANLHVVKSQYFHALTHVIPPWIGTARWRVFARAIDSLPLPICFRQKAANRVLLCLREL